MVMQVTINVPSRDRRKKNYTMSGKTFVRYVGDQATTFVLQDDGCVSHYYTGGLVVTANAIAARKLSNYVGNPYSKGMSTVDIAKQIIGEIDPQRFQAAIAKVPQINP